jgi:hypothetical protein
MSNGIVKIVFLVGLIGSCGYLAYRLGISNCREDVANERNEIQQVVQESDRVITEKVLGASHLANLTFLCENYRRAD